MKSITLFICSFTMILLSQEKQSAHYSQTKLIHKVAIEIGDLGYLAFLSVCPECHDSGVSKGKTHQKLQVWKQNFSLIYNAIQEKRSATKTRDIIKETVSFRCAMVCYARRAFQSPML